MCRTSCVPALVLMVVGLAQSWDIAVTAGDRLEFYTNGTKMDTVLFHSQNLTALAYDQVHNMLLYVNKQTDNDAICGYNISYVEYKCYVERKGGNIQGLAFDPITEILFFTDTKEKSINWMSFKPGSKNNVNGNLLIKMSDGIPTDIAVDSCRGYIYWINTNVTTSTIERALFNGAEREVVINAANNWDLHSLAIGQQTQKIYWIMRESSKSAHIGRADLSGKNNESLLYYAQGDEMFSHPNALTVSKEALFMTDWCKSCGPRSVWKFPKPGIQTSSYNSFLKIHTKSVVGIAAKYKIGEQIQGIQDCKASTNLVPNNYISDDSLKIAREYAEPYCDHGIKDNGESLCKCTPGYTGKQCDVSVCGNYCLQGSCSINENGLPKCRCRTGYSGERCEVDACHGYCVNNGTCSLNDEEKPVCQCIEHYAGDRCEVSDCLNYCLQGDCSYNELGRPECRCRAGYFGERCEVDACHNYCSNNGTCSLNEEEEPVCQCVEHYSGDKCEVSDCLNYCLQGDCSYNEQGLPECRCRAGYFGERCEVDACHNYCSNNGTCSLNEEEEPVCQCVEHYSGDKCEVSDCLNYCLQGDCSYNEQGLPECRCRAGYFGERCEVDACHGYCVNNGTCYLNEEEEPVCQCVEDYVGDRCDVPVCLNNGDCSLEGSSRTADKKDTTRTYTVERNLTLADLLTISRKPVSRIVIVEI